MLAGAARAAFVTAEPSPSCLVGGMVRPSLQRTASRTAAMVTVTAPTTHPLKARPTAAHLTTAVEGGKSRTWELGTDYPARAALEQAACAPPSPHSSACLPHAPATPPQKPREVGQQTSSLCFHTWSHHWWHRRSVHQPASIWGKAGFWPETKLSRKVDEVFAPASGTAALQATTP